MKKAVLYICHGSRVKKAREEALEFISKSKRSVDAPIQEICFLELAEPDIKTGFETCVAKGADSIAVIPVLLLTAAHAKSDIPEELESVMKEHPSVSVSYGDPIGVQGEMAEAVLEGMRPLPAHEDARVLLVGRGSSDPDVKRDLGLIAKGIEQRTEGLNVSVCYLTAAEPSFSEVLNGINQFPEKRVYIVPYLLFTGLLMNGIEKEISLVKTDKILTLCSYVGFSRHTEKAFTKRVREALGKLSSSSLEGAV
ncbi:sirohydrochlorin chelatase [Bacillus sp. FJAT-42376]|uniref:sirohydrochlorin chelatase n=1 Tax=Bacillus sp. FJAT-42376 TaxID=2014076 RepID=UPI000F502D47|nr:sirohydrochlorin chelatase [Bacillus sp. FJAT-42376]AZB42876.1 sirohydrochlorin chelatase [Bacillus sp. FJAT-42376]